MSSLKNSIVPGEDEQRVEPVKRRVGRPRTKTEKVVYYGPDPLPVLPEDQRWIPGSEGRYSISIDGVPRSYIRNKVDGEVMNTYLSDFGYPVLSVRGVLGKPKAVSHGVHRLILFAFVGPPGDGMIARHLDGNPAHCHLRNLKWGTRQENGADMIRHGTCGTHASKLSAEDVLEIRRRYAEGGISMNALSKEYGVKPPAISGIISRKKWKHI